MARLRGVAAEGRGALRRRGTDMPFSRGVREVHCSLGVLPPTIRSRGVLPPTIRSLGVLPPTMRSLGVLPPTMRSRGVLPPTIRSRGVLPPTIRLGVLLLTLSMRRGVLLDTRSVAHGAPPDVGRSISLSKRGIRLTEPECFAGLALREELFPLDDALRPLDLGRRALRPSRAETPTCGSFMRIKPPCE